MVRNWEMLHPKTIEVALPQVSRFHEFGGDIGELDTAVAKLLVR